MRWIFSLFSFYALAQPESGPGVQVSRRRIDPSCPDADLGELCDEDCFEKWIKCKDGCFSSSCERQCAGEWTDCYRACPCDELCPNGCENCANPICSCKHPENDPYFKQCLKEAGVRLEDCFKSCATNNTCYDGCYDVFDEEKSFCPCMDNCPMGCSCDGGYECQTHVMVLGQGTTYYNDFPNFSYLISADGDFKEKRHYESPLNVEYGYLFGSGHAILRGDVYFFGSIEGQAKKISKLSGCKILNTGTQLVAAFNALYGSLATVSAGTESVILCNGYSTNCESFDGEKSQFISSTQISHRESCMAEFENAPMIIGSYSPSSNRVEILTTSGWQDTAPHLHEIFYHTCLSVSNGVLTIGGYLNDGDERGYTKNVYLFRDDQWAKVGVLQSPFDLASSIHFGENFLVFGGVQTRNVERAMWDGQNVTSSMIINEHGGDCIRPIIFEINLDSCTEGCDDFCYY
ncbi:Oidioi.mRNA.OKI2018_I69.chr1.g1338.t1.cds [Oikopleura dioica]|uniref:Oidioi.mRNA.OKI2018_I69.chr1.g1338.t1.cds n=1 Tax=Oikopleura dioica TaxID=34765 RepID=A0ABN7SRU1_OIKDI|nr:Oidioi.mRNA.OKI2018_I69.chr1.g1338.t1.cds [Oikopleura dioica]